MRGEQLLGQYDPEVGETLAAALKAEGPGLLTGTEILAVEGGPGGVRLTVRREGRQQVLEAEALLVATGRIPDTAALNLSAAGLEPGPRGEIRVDATLQSANPRVYAAGDVTGGPQFVYVAWGWGTVPRWWTWKRCRRCCLRARGWRRWA